MALLERTMKYRHRMSQPTPITGHRRSAMIDLFLRKCTTPDYDLAEFYGIETRYLKRRVQKKGNRFSDDGMFTPSREEYNSLRDQHSKYVPLAFGVQGIAILSSVLSGKTVSQANIQIVRVFACIRKIFFSPPETVIKLKQLVKQFLKHDSRTGNNDRDIRAIVAWLKDVLNSPGHSGKRIGFTMGNINR
jgi:hypothetical protein